MKGKGLRLFLANAVLVLAVFFLFLLAVGWALPELAVFEGAFVQGALAVFSVLALMIAVFELIQALRAGDCRQGETDPDEGGQ
ncbi:MAG TPA: hypothetical protein P5075_00230 [Eubacteriales bacterium]|nr:hypothetical protein [Eubacteriales bacterium]